MKINTASAILRAQAARVAFAQLSEAERDIRSRTFDGVTFTREEIAEITSEMEDVAN